MYPASGAPQPRLGPLLLLLVFLLGPAGGASFQTIAPAAAARLRAQIQTLENVLDRVPDRGAALFLLAARHAALGDRPAALDRLRECLTLDEGFDPDGDPAFEPLASDPRFRELVAAVQRGRTPVHHARVAFTVPATDLFPEGLAYDAASRVFYMGSMHHRKIVAIAESGAVSDFVQEGAVPNLLPVGGVHVDPSDRSVWAATDGPEFVHFDSRGTLLDRFRYTDGGDHLFNDLVLRGSRDIYLTDTRGNGVYRFDRATHRFAPLRFGRTLFGPNGITLSSDENRLYVADSLGVIAVDLRTSEARDVDPGPHNTLAGMDGLYFYKGGLVGVQYGTGAFRVIHSALSADGLRATSTDVLETRTPLVSFPTTGAIVGDRFYYIANTGIANLDADRIVDPARLEPVHIAVVPLGGR